MRTISHYEFFNDFLKISENLTLTELQILRILISEPEVIELSQREIAEKIGTHRRTINIGLKKLINLNYIVDVSVTDRNKRSLERQSKSGFNNLSSFENLQAKKFIIDSLKEFYHPFNEKSRIINADFYCSVLGDHRLPEYFRYNNNYIIVTIKDEFPSCKFHFKQRRTSYISDNYYNITRIVNREIIKSSKYLRSEVKKDMLFKSLFEQYSINEEEVLKIIKKEFPKITFYKNRIKIPKPWKMKISG